MEPKQIPRHKQLIEQLRNIGFHDHLCLVPADPSEQMEVFTAYLAWAGVRRERCLPLLMESSRTVLDRRLARLGYPAIAEAGGDTVRSSLQAARAGHLLEHCRGLGGPAWQCRRWRRAASSLRHGLANPPRDEHRPS
jgi:hypothetical protein